MSVPLKGVRRFGWPVITVVLFLVTGCDEQQPSPGSQHAKHARKGSSDGERVAEVSSQNQISPPHVKAATALGATTAPTVAVGTVLQLRCLDEDAVIVSRTAESYAPLIQLMIANDRDGIRLMLSGGTVLTIPDGTRARVIGIHYDKDPFFAALKVTGNVVNAEVRRPILEVRLLEGVFSGSAVFYADLEWLREFTKE